MKKRLDAVEKELAGAEPLRRLQLVQERMDLERELAGAEAKAGLAELENAFVKAAKPYGQRKGISYAAWRELGVPASVLKRAGISRAGG